MNRLLVSGSFLVLYQALLLSALFHPVGWFYKLSAWILSTVSIFVFAGLYVTRKIPPKPKSKPKPPPPQYDDPIIINRQGRGTEFYASHGYGSPAFWPKIIISLETVDPIEIDNMISWLKTAKNWLVLRREDRIREGQVAFLKEPGIEQSL